VFLLYPKSCAKSWSQSGVGFGGVDPWALFIPRCPGATGLTDALDQSDRCKPFMGFTSGERLGVFPVVMCCYCLVLGRFRGVWLGFV
jgi:hypothetical protein